MKKAFFIIIIIITMKEQTWKMKNFPVHRILKALVIHSKHNSVLHIQIVKGNVLILSASQPASQPTCQPARPPAPFGNLIDLRCGRVDIRKIYRSNTCSIYPMRWNSQQFVFLRRKSSLCPSMLGNQAIPIMLLHSSCLLSAATCFRLNELESVWIYCRRIATFLRLFLWESSLW